MGQCLIAIQRLLGSSALTPRFPKPLRRFLPEVECCEPRLVLTPAPAGQFVGAAFGPYVKQWVNGHPPAFNSYTTGNASVAKQVALAAKTFHSIATYTSGFGSYYPANQPYDKVDSAWEVPIAAAKLNKAQNRLALTVSQGIYQRNTPAQMTSEIDEAFKIAKVANKIYPGTVNRLIFTNEYVTNATTTNQVNELITKYKPAAHKMGLQVGVRSQTFGQLNNGSPPDFVAALQNLVKNVDFIMANIYPYSETVTMTNGQPDVSADVANVAQTYNMIKTAALQLNPNIKVLIGETGWASQGISFNNASGTLNTVANAEAYYNAIVQWADTNNVQTFYFEAIDEPWKSNPNINNNQPDGANGAEAHYGLYTYNSSGNSGKFVAKW
jgi:exo-beta-1,3-glucanase (GH17 family)